ncbi:HPP family protein [Cognatazoarcus halotolerans]|uniref:HPP family protein n=1 Tax=Cognatazoarcus halotolerans TaxID=2686016 RepID=UPI001F35A625|nr:HPP family protein [Cognatazoarcus halotolerans]
MSWREWFFSCLGAFIGLVCTELIGRHTLGALNPWFVAPMGASAVLLFAVPSSPLAQPWSIVGGNMVSAVVGVSCASLIEAPGMAAALAVALAIGAMMKLRCLHPPGGAVALTSVLGGSAVTSLGYQFVFWPVGLNSLCLLVFALIFNHAAGRRYPHGAPVVVHPHGTHDPLPSERLGVTLADVDAVLAVRGDFIDVNREDLEGLVVAVERRIHQRFFGELRCEDVMSRDVVCVDAGASLVEAWTLLTRHQVKALPVVAGERLAGILSLHDFFVSRARPHELDASPVFNADSKVRDLMSASVTTAAPGQAAVELVPLFADQGLHHVPVVDVAQRVLGMLTQSDLVAALFRMRIEEALSGAPRAAV